MTVDESGELQEEGYLYWSQLPLTSLVFLLPLIIIYEIGIRRVWPNADYRADIIAFQMMEHFFLLFGATGRYMPALAIIGILFTWHLARRDEWRVRLQTLGGMAVESILLGIPLIFLSVMCSQYLPMTSATTSGGTWGQTLVLSIGAGLYEEAVFRLGAMTLLSIFLTDLLKVPVKTGAILIVLLPAVAFSAYHYLGDEPFRWASFVFRTAAGIYFGLIFWVRGFGITAGSHAAYDVWVVLISLLRH